MSIESANRTFFQRNDPQLLEEIAPDARVQVEQAKREGLTLKIDGKYVHSKYHPGRDAKTIMDRAGYEPQKLHLHFGFGLGYFLEHDQTDPDAQVLIFEPDPGIAAAAIQAVPLAELFQEKNAVLCCSERRFRALIRSHLNQTVTIRVFISPYHKDAYRIELNRFVELLKQERNRKSVLGSKVAHRVFRTIHQATLRAMPFVTQLPGLEKLANQFRNIPVVVVTAGPSLEKNVAELYPYRNKILIFAVARAVRVLERHGIEPHFLVQTESQDYHHLIEGCSNLDRTSFLLADQCHTSYYQHQSRPIFTYQNPGNLMTVWLNEKMPHLKKQAIATGGSVATDAFSCALILGCNPIVLTGQDLALTGGRYYASSATNSSFSHRDTDRRNTAGYFGGRIDTLANYLHFLAWYEDAAEVYKEQRPGSIFINATEGGAMIRGFDNFKLREVLWRYATRQIDTSIIRKACRLKPHQKLPSKELKDLFRNSLHQIYSAGQICQRFPDFKKSFLQLLHQPTQTSRIQEHIEQLDKMGRSLEAIYTDLKILAGFRDEDLAPAPSNQLPATNIEDSIIELRESLENFEQNIQATQFAINRLAPILHEMTANSKID